MAHLAQHARTEPLAPHLRTCRRGEQGRPVARTPPRLRRPGPAACGPRPDRAHLAADGRLPGPRRCHRTRRRRRRAVRPSVRGDVTSNDRLSPRRARHTTGATSPSRACGGPTLRRTGKPEDTAGSPPAATASCPRIPRRGSAGTQEGQGRARTARWWSMRPQRGEYHRLGTPGHGQPPHPLQEAHAVRRQTKRLRGGSTSCPPRVRPGEARGPCLRGRQPGCGYRRRSHAR